MGGDWVSSERLEPKWFRCLQDFGQHSLDTSMISLNIKDILYFCANIKYNISTKVGDIMTAKEIIKSEIIKHNGIITVNQIENSGISKTVFYQYVKDNDLEKIGHGIYADGDAWIDDMYVLSLRCPGMIFSHEEALFLHGLTDREPLIHTVTVKTGYNPSRINPEECKVYTIKKDLYDMGLTIMKNTFGNEVPVYNIERTVCDIIRSRRNVEFQDFQSAIKGYVSRKSKDINLLMDYAEKLRVKKIVRQYLEVLL